MSTLSNLILVLVAGCIAAFGTGVGTVPLFWIRDISDRVNVGLWGLAGGLMASASVFGLLAEAFKEHSSIWFVGAGFVCGALLVVGAHYLVEKFGGEAEPEDIAEANFQTFLNVLTVLFVHSFPEGVAIGVSFAELNKGTGFHWFGFTVPVVALVITGALAIHNMPEGLAVGIPLRKNEGVSNSYMFGAATLTSVPQPIAAVIAFYFVRIAIQFLGFGYGFAAGSMLYLVADDIIPEGLEEGEDLPDGGKKPMATGLVVGIVAMLPLLLYT